MSKSIASAIANYYPSADVTDKFHGLLSSIRAVKHEKDWQLSCAWIMHHLANEMCVQLEWAKNIKIGGEL